MPITFITCLHEQSLDFTFLTWVSAQLFLSLPVTRSAVRLHTSVTCYTVNLYIRGSFKKSWSLANNSKTTRSKNLRFYTNIIWLMTDVYAKIGFLAFARWRHLKFISATCSNNVLKQENCNQISHNWTIGRKKVLIDWWRFTGIFPALFHC